MNCKKTEVAQLAEVMQDLKKAYEGALWVMGLGLGLRLVGWA